MLHGAAGRLRQPLKLLGNILQHMQNGQRWVGRNAKMPMNKGFL
jgi:hypothetical protein